jgi:serine/threonine protein phosphatase PrpC
MTFPDMQVSSGEYMNPTKRNNMEDTHVTHQSNSSEWDHKSTFIGVYDGHGGRDIAEFLEETLHLNIAQELNQSDEASIHERLERAFLMTDVQSKMKHMQTSGSTVACCIIEREFIKEKQEMKISIHAANAGDARAVLSCRPSLLSSIHTCDGQSTNENTTHVTESHNYQKALRLTSDHKADDPKEIERIENAGGFILRNRVLGIMAVARSLGDHGMKEYVIAKPYCKSINFLLPLASEETNNKDTSGTDIDTGTGTDLDIDTREFVILACDGIWDVMEDWEAVDLVKLFVGGYANNDHDANHHTNDTVVDERHARQQRNERRNQAAKALCKEAIVRGTTDNITALVAWL